MFIINKRRAFYNYTSVILSLCTILFVIFTTGCYYEDGSFTFRIYMLISFLLICSLFNIYYVINTIYDNHIRKSGTIKKAKIIKVDNSYRYGDTIIVFEYKNRNGEIIHTKEMISRSFHHYFGENERIQIRTNGIKGVISRKDYK